MTGNLKRCSQKSLSLPKWRRTRVRMLLQGYGGQCLYLYHNIIFDVGHSPRYQNSQDGSISANASCYPITAPVPTLAPHVSGFRSSSIHVTPTFDPSGPTYLSRTLPPDDGIRSNGFAKSPNATPCAGIESHRYWTRLSYGN